MTTFVSRTARITGCGLGVLSPMRWQDLSLSAQSQGLDFLSYGCEPRAWFCHGDGSEAQDSALCRDIEVVDFWNVLQCFVGLASPGSEMSFLRA